MLAALAAEVDGYEVASGGELALARIARAGIGSATQIVFGGPAKTDAELAAAVEAEATVNVESLLELRRLAVTAETTGTRVRTVLRVNRRFDAGPCPAPCGWPACRPRSGSTSRSWARRSSWPSAIRRSG